MPRRKRKQAAAKASPTPDPAPQPAEVRADSPAGSGLNAAKMTVAQLREELEARGEETRGKKAELVARLQAAIEEEGDAREPPSEKTKVRHDLVPQASWPELETALSGVHIIILFFLCTKITAGP